MRGKLSKIEERVDAVHKNNIPTNYTIIGDVITRPKVGTQFLLTNSYFHTSTVVEILEQNEKLIRFRTFNSIYELTWLY